MEFNLQTDLSTIHEQTELSPKREIYDENKKHLNLKNQSPYSTCILLSYRNFL